jgi:hypothetical protein
MQGPVNQLQLYRNVITIGMRTTDPDALLGWANLTAHVPPECLGLLTLASSLQQLGLNVSCLLGTLS